MDFYRRRLPHLHIPGQPVFLTWQLVGSLPTNRRFPSEISSGEAFVTMDRLLDHAREGPMWLRQPEIAGMVVDALFYREETMRHFSLHNFVIMPNHVHILITPRVAVPKLMHSLKRFTALEGNRMLGVSGQSFWQTESYDHLVRNLEEFNKIGRYIELNPVTAGLAPTPEDFPWSSGRPVGNRPQV